MIAPRQGLLVVLSGPSGVGKGTVVSEAMRLPTEAAARIRRSISVTTRPPRVGEVEGVDYFFRSPEEFEQLAAEGRLLEWATYLDYRYGTPGDWVDQQLTTGYDVVLEIEVKGAMQVRERRPEATLIYMVPPSWAELRRRLSIRGTDSAETQQRRIQKAREELEFVVAHQEVLYAKRYDYVITNDIAEAAAGRFLAIVEAERWRVGRLDLSPLSHPDEP